MFFKFCGKYHIHDYTYECQRASQIWRGERSVALVMLFKNLINELFSGMKICLKSSKDYLPIPGNEAARGRRFKLMLNNQCEGKLSFVQKSNVCSCHEDQTFIIV